jgi:hypothetical protein
VGESSPTTAQSRVRQWWQAEHCINAIRDHALAVACLRHQLPTAFGRGFDDLPADVLAPFADARVRSLERDELLRALVDAVEGLLRDADGTGEVATKAAPRIRAWLPPSVPTAQPTLNRVCVRSPSCFQKSEPVDPIC